VVEPEVEDRVEHAGHRVARARAHGYEQRICRIAEPLAGTRLEPREGIRHLAGQVVGLGLPAAHVRDARLGGNGEARRDAVRAEHARHLGDVLAPLPPSRSRMSRDRSAKS
jgi:hypothetical protein